MKKTLAFLAALTFAVTAFAGCGSKDDDPSSEKSEKKTAATSAAEESKEEDSKEKEEVNADELSEAEESKEDADSTDAESSEEPAESQESSSDENTMSLDINTEDLDISGMFHEIEMPSTKTVSADESDFTGKWECYCMVSDGMAYDSMLGMPLYAVLHFELNADHTGVLSSAEDPDTGERETESMTWEYSGDQIELVSESNGEKLVGKITDEGYLVLESAEQNEQIYLRSVAEFTEFDWSSLADMFGGMAEIPEE